MSQFTPIRPSRYRSTSAPATWAVFTFPALGFLAAATSDIVGFVISSFLGTIALGDGAGPGQPAYDYAEAHFPNGPLGFLTGSPLILTACCILVLGATGLAAYRRWVLAVLLLLVTAVLAVVPSLAFTYHLWQLAVIPTS